MNSQIILAKNIKLDKNYTNVLNFTESQMLNLLNQNIVVSSNKFSFIRANGSIQVSFSYSSCLSANYLAFQNPDYSNKWFFAFIDDIIYRGDNNCEIKYTIDVWSTWFSNWTAKPCFVKRHHVESDEIGEHTLDEGLDIGEVVQDLEENIDKLTNKNKIWIAIMSNYDPSEKKSYSGAVMYNRNIFGSKIFLISGSNNAEIMTRLSLFIYDTNKSRSYRRNKRHIYCARNINSRRLCRRF